MFTGLIEELGVVEKLSKTHDILKLKLKAQKITKGIKIGDSIAVNGVCLTVVKFDALNIDFDIMQETIKKTNFNALKTGDTVNLERAMLMQSRVGGHFVTGHIDTTGQLLEKTNQGASIYLKIGIDDTINKYIVAQGAIAVDGVSLTVAECNDKHFGVYLIPHTIESTNLKFRRIGDKLNLEVDMLAKYVHKALEQKTGRVTPEKLKELGYI